MTKAIKSSQPAVRLIGLAVSFFNSSAPFLSSLTSSNIVPAWRGYNDIRHSYYQKKGEIMPEEFSKRSERDKMAAKGGDILYEIH